MTDFVANPTELRTIASAAGDILIEQIGKTTQVNGRSASSTMLVDDIAANPKHYMGHMVADFRARSAVAVVVTEIDGKTAQICLTAEDWAKGADERARYAVWLTEYADRRAAERQFDIVNNEGGEGYNPHRSGAAHTYRGR